jgi:dTDP-4-amino-4,6-dideoxygalactose transaminase
MIPYGRQDISIADIDAVVEVLRSDWLTQGPMAPRFEQAVANYVGAQHAVAVNSATSALHIACLALDVGPGDWVWTSPNTFVASANCALYCGAKVDFVDIDPRTYNLSVERLAEKLKEAKAKNRLPKVVIPVHFAGQPCDMPAIHELCEEYGFKIIEDASHAIGASYITPIIASHDNETVIGRSGEAATWQSGAAIKVGSCTHSHITVFSFHPVKIITTGEGGMALTNDPGLAEKMARLRAHGITNKPELMHSRPPGEIWNYQQTDLGFNYRMSDIQAALGLSQLQRLDDFVGNRRDIAAAYDHALKDLPVITPWQDPKTRSAYHLYPIRINVTDRGQTQRSAYEALRREGVGVNLHYIPVYLQPYFETLGFTGGYCPAAECYFKQTISLPLFSSLPADEFQKVVRVLEKIFHEL